MDLDTFIDMAAALAILALLAESYGAVRRRLANSTYAPIILGSLFGLMAKVLMHRPLEPFDGMIIDLRNIPIALAGAFLGWRGLLPCLAIAIAARLHLSGVGTMSGICGMLLAGLAGMIWSRKMALYEKRTFGMLLLLALAMSTHLLAAVVLPRDMAIWFFTSAAGPILAMNLVAVPMIGALLERENRRIQQENLLAAAATRDPKTGFLTGSAFVREVTNAFAAQPLGSFAGVLAVSPQSRGWRGVFCQGNAVSKTDLDAHMFSNQLTHWSLAGLSADGRILIPLTEHEVEISHRTRSAARDVLADHRADMPTRQAWDVSVIATENPGIFLRLIESAALTAQPLWTLNARGVEYSTGKPNEGSFVRRSSIFDAVEHDALFVKANFLIERGRS